MKRKIATNIMAVPSPTFLYINHVNIKTFKLNLNVSRYYYVVVKSCPHPGMNCGFRKNHNKFETIKSTRIDVS